MVQEIIVNNDTCGRCGEATKRRLRATDPEIDFVLACMICGWERVFLKNRYERVLKSNEVIKEIRIKSYRAGLRKYRHNNNSIPFKGNPIDVGQKNIAALINCIKIIGQNIEIEKEEIIIALLNQVGIRLEQIRPHLVDVEINVNENQLFWDKRS